MLVYRVERGAAARLYSMGVELSYGGDHFEYDGSYPVLLFFYWPSYSVCYCVDSLSSSDSIPQVEGRCRKVFRAEGKVVNRIKEFLRLHKGDGVLRLGSSFWLELYCVLLYSRSWRVDSELLFLSRTGGLS